MKMKSMLFRELPDLFDFDFKYLFDYKGKSFEITMLVYR